MATITGITAEAAEAILDGVIVDADVVGDNLILTKQDGTTINAGNVRGPTGATGSDPIEAWHLIGGSGEPALQNAGVTWTNYGPSLRFKKDRGVVFLDGEISVLGAGAAAGALLFTLPVGYRPTGRMYVTIRSNTSPGTAYGLKIGTDGTVKVDDNGPAWPASSILNFGSSSFRID